MNEYLLILKMIASQKPKCEEQEIFPGQVITKKCPVCERVITMAKIAVQEARVWKMAYNGADAQCREKEKELDHLRILYRNHFKRQRRKTRRNRRRR